MTSEEQYRRMRLIRRFEERLVGLVNANEVAGVTHESIGQEAVAVGVCAELERTDVITSTHRGHGHLIAKGAAPRDMMAELLGRTTGTNRGRGGSMHIADLAVGVYGANGIVGAGTPWAVGAAWAAVQDGSGGVVASFFGDGAINQGVVLESFNLAAIWKLPVIFVCENNGYAVTMPSEVSTAGRIVARAAAFDIPAEEVDGMDVDAVRAAARRCVERARAGGGPSFLDCRTYRFVGHHTAEHTMGLDYRTDAELERWRARDPVPAAAASLSPAARDAIDREVEDVLDAAVEYARASPRPEPADALDYVYASGPPPRPGVA